MKKIVSICFFIGSVIMILSAQSVFAYDQYQKGCQTCHGSGYSGTSTLHSRHSGQSCTICHTGAGGSLPVLTNNCAGCHPLTGTKGLCPIINVATHASTKNTCLACHTNCAPTTTTTSVLPTTTIPTTTTIRPTTTTTSVQSTTTTTVMESCPNYDNIQTLVREYYLDILDREPDQEGWDYWSDEICRIIQLGIYVGEGFQAEARLFFNSQEYIDKNKTNSEFVTDLYQTFLQREPDAGGLAFWVGELSCLTRNMLITQFAYSAEFKQYMEDIFGPDTTRPENNLVNDFYRGFLNRFPDDGGYNSWLLQMQQAQCTSAEAVQDLSYQLSLLFIQSTEYAGRNRNNVEYVEDLYNAILRRGADCDGFQAWINNLNTGMSREDMLQTFTASPEFQTRVDAVIAAGCILP